MKNKQYILAIDGGGTKTDMVMADENGKILAQVKQGRSNLHNIIPDRIEKYFHEGLHQLLKKAKLSSRTKLSAITIGLAGLDSPADYKIADRVIRKALKNHLPENKNISIVNDAIIGFWSGTHLGRGICVIGGTGSNCYGVSQKGKEAWSGGLGHILADDGSGYEMGIKILHAVAKAEDGRGPKTKLTEKVFAHFGVKSIRDLVPLVYYGDFEKEHIAELAYLIEVVGLRGDKVAQQIAYDAADELALMAETVAKKLRFKKSDSFDLVLIGGVLQNDPFVIRRFKKQVKKFYPNINFIIPQVKPVMGAVRMARFALNDEMSPEL